MKSRLQAILIGLSTLAIATSAAAHQSHFGPGSGLSGSITISTGVPYPSGFYGTLHYGRTYPIVPAYYPQAVFYRDCGHWHGSHYDRYNRASYAHGYHKYHGKGRKHGRGHGGGHGEYRAGYGYHH